jgi:hypothetical protein
MLPKMPKFATEREEADWWYEQRDAIGEEFTKAIAAGLKSGPSSHARQMAALRGITPEQWIAEKKAGREATPKHPVKLPHAA